MKKIKLNVRGKLISITSTIVVVSLVSLGVRAYIVSSSSVEGVIEKDLIPVVLLADKTIESNYSSEQDLDKINALLKTVKLGSTGYVYVMDSKSKLLVHPTKRGSTLTGFDFAQEIVRRAANLKKGETDVIRYDWINKELGETKPRQKIAVFTYFKEQDFIVVAGSYIEEFTSEAKSNIMNAILYTIVPAIVLSIIVGSIFANRIARPIILLKNLALKVADGELTNTITIKSKDEIGELANSFNKMITDMRDTISRVAESSSAVASASSQISSSTEEMAAGAQEQTSQAGEVASAVEEMTKTIVENSKNASVTAETAKQAKSSAEDGGRIVQETVIGMRRIAEVVNRSAMTVKALGESSDQIGEIIGVIDDIADQTNLLALNAAIEAARAGEQGRGFAVVADEVRKLAERTTKATKEIAEMIKKIQSETVGAVNSMEEGTKEVESGIRLVDRAGASLREIVDTSQKVTDMVMQIAAASEEQSSASEQISKNVEAISSVTNESAQGTQQIARAAEDLNRLTEGLQQLIGKFKLSDDENSQSKEHALNKMNLRKEPKSNIAVRANGSLVHH